MNETNKKTFTENYIYTILTVNNILKNGNYSVQSFYNEQQIKFSVEEETDFILLEVKLQEKAGLEFINNLNYNNLTKHIPVLMETKSKTQFFHDEKNLQKINGYDEKSGEAFPMLLIKINAKNVS